MQIVKASRSLASALTDLTIRSKSHWNYKDEQIDQWSEELSIEEEYIEANSVYVIFDKTKLVGYYSYFKLSEDVVKLDCLFIEPEYIGSGYGKVLLQDFLNRMKKGGYHKITLEADPHATDFYKKYGFKIVGQLPSSVRGRSLPIMELEFC